MLHSVVSWLDAERWHFWALATAALLVWSVSVVYSPASDNVTPAARPKPTWKLWALASLILMVAWRWPYLAGMPIGNPDEAQMVAGAITLKSRPLFWKHVDGTTHGPITELPLLLAQTVGVPLTYGGARFVAGILTLGGLVLAGRGLMLIYQPLAVRVGLAPAMLLWATISFYDFTGYTSEQTSIFLFLASVWPLLAGLLPGECRHRTRILCLTAAGFLLGCIPYAKLQGCPLGVAVGGTGIAALAAQTSLPRVLRAKLVGALVGGALLPTALLALYLWIWQLHGQFWISYISSNLLYASAGWSPMTEMWAALWSFMRAVPGLHAMSLMVLSLALAAIVFLTWPRPRRRWPWLPTAGLSWNAGWRHVPMANRWVLLAVLLVSLAGIYASLAPQRFFEHYLQYAGAGIGLGGAALTGELWRQFQFNHIRPCLIATGFLLIAGLVPWSIAYPQPNYPDMLGAWTRNHGEWRSPTSVAIKQLARPGDMMSVWGWMPYFHVETGLPHATRESHTYRQIEPGPLQEFYRQRYLLDFTRNAPRLFVDAVGGKNFGYGEARLNCRHETFLELSTIIQRDYELVREIEGSRIYLRKTVHPKIR